MPRITDTGHKFWLASLASVLWLACVAALLATRLSEWWPLFQPPMSRNRLSLTEISVFLIAVFAPLTFLWLSVLILLQRREQTIQRRAVDEFTRGSNSAAAGTPKNPCGDDVLDCGNEPDPGGDTNNGRLR